MATTKKATEEVTTNEEELFDYYAPLSRDKQDDIVVTINGYTTVIQRGENVKVKKPVYEVLMNMEKMDTIAIQKMRELEGMKKLNA